MLSRNIQIILKSIINLKRKKYNTILSKSINITSLTTRKAFSLELLHGQHNRVFPPLFQIRNSLNLLNFSTQNNL